MKAIVAGCLPADHRASISATPSFTKIAALFVVSISLFFLVKRVTFNSFTITNSDPSDQREEFRLAFYSNVTAAVKNSSTPCPPPPFTPPAPTAMTVIQRTGIVDESGTMTDNFIVGEFDEALVDTVVDMIEKAKSDEKRKVEEDGVVKIKIEKFKVCGDGMTNYIPCLDDLEAMSELNSSGREEKFVRHCPEREKGLDCLVPKPKGYKKHIQWPKSRDEVWYDNVPLTGLFQDIGGQKWIARKGDRVIFPVRGIQDMHDVDQYLDQISKMVPEIEFGKYTRVALDIGSGVASFGAYLMKRNVTTLSIAPKGANGNQIQISLERGVPAMVAAFTTRRLLYPSQAFDLIHCSECKINWTRDDVLLLELNRMLRAGRYFVWASEAVGKRESDLIHQWKGMESLARTLCWELVKKEGYISIWQKPLNNTCYLNRVPGLKPSVCNEDDDPDDVWYVDLKTCISRLPENGYGSNVANWPDRLHLPPDRLLTIKMDADTSRKDIYRADSNFFNEMAEGYVKVFRWRTWNLRNVMDMKAGYGGFATALHDLHIDCWVMNVVPVSSSNTLPVIYDRGLIGVVHDWCQPFNTYPRTYDLLYAAELLSSEQKRKRCNISTIMLEMDRILRPGGRAFLHDFTTTIDEVEEIVKAMGWTTWRGETANGPYAIRRLLYCTKPQ